MLDLSPKVLGLCWVSGCVMAAVRVATLARVAARAADGGAAEWAGCPQGDDDPTVRVQSEFATRLSVYTLKHTGFQYMLRDLRVLSVSPVLPLFHLIAQ
jgi:hypothetical protein